jgi:methionyl-tRNA formyltransferase
MAEQSMTASEWWQRPRRISVLVDNPSWILPFAEALVEDLGQAGETVGLCRHASELPVGDVAFFLGCIHLVPPKILSRHRYNLVVHESDLPKGRGFSPLTWQVLDGRNLVPICLLDAADDADAGDVYFHDQMRFEGHELIDEIRALQAATTLALCRRFLDQEQPPTGRPQEGPPSHYPRLRSEDSRIDPRRSLAEQFDRLRTVDNERYPAFFDLHGHRYQLSIRKIEPGASR